MRPYLFFLILVLFMCQQIHAQISTSKQFDSLAQKFPVISYKAGKYKVEEIVYPSERILSGHGYDFDSIGTWIDQGFEQVWQERVVTTRVNGQIFTSSMLEDHIENNEYPAAFFTMKKVQALKKGRLIFLAFYSDQGISSGMCGAASSFSFDVYYHKKKRDMLTYPSLLSMSYGSCAEPTKIKLNGKDSLADFMPDSLYWFQNELVLLGHSAYSAVPYSGSEVPVVKLILSFQENKSGDIVASLRKEETDTH